VTVALEESSNVAYIEVGKERLYVPINKVKNVQNNEPSERALTEIGFVRVKAGYTLYRDADYTDRLLNGTLETRFEVTEISNNGARINWAGGSAYVKRADMIQYPNLPYQLLRNTPIFKANSQVIYGSLQANAIVMPSAMTEKEMTVSNSGTRYKLPLDIVIEQDELIAQPVSTKYAIDVQTKTAIDVRSVTGTVIGTVEAGQTVRISNTTNQMASMQFFGQEGTFPLEAIYHTNLVDGAKHVTYEQVVKTLKDIHALYPAFTKLEIIGQTVEGRLIYALKVGNGQREILMDASMHAREHMTTNVLMEMIDQYTTAYARNTTFAGYNVKQTLDKTSIWFVPMINADGVTLVQKGVQAVASKNTVIQINGSSNVARWKANIRGVDLNRNFDNKWAEFKTITSPAWSGFKGNSVFSEPESKALRDFVAKHDFKAYISYHSSGNLLYYWNWQNSLHEARDFAFAKKIGSKTGYSVMKPLYRTSSGSSADWFIRVYKKPGITMEISPYAGDQPVPLKNWADVWKRNQSIGLLSAKESENF
jgi:g-D-glutamyl-meso-diaminopimelate peptidase